MNVGHTSKEKELMIAQGFPNLVMADNEAIISRSYAEFFGLNTSLLNQELFDPNMQISLKFDYLKMLAGSNSTKIKDILLNESIEATSKFKAQALLEAFGFDKDISMIEFVDQTNTYAIIQSQSVQYLLARNNIHPSTKLYGLL